jgi:putative membrane protein insertion efficiency factor
MIKNIILFFIKIYKRFFSPIFHHLGIDCRFYPTCSEYIKQAIQKYGTLKGILLGIRRILKCNPFSKGGYDPLK